MPRRSGEENQLPSDSDYAMPPTDRRKGGAERVSFGGEGSSSIPSPVKEIKFEMRGLAQEQSSQCATPHCVSHVTPILYRPALQYPFSSEVSNSIISPEKQIHAPQSKHIADEDEDEWKVIVLPIMNKQLMRMRMLMTFYARERHGNTARLR
jgi:hypothetical protein